MHADLSVVAATARRWTRFSDVPETVSQLAHILVELADHACVSGCPAAETVDAMRVIGCHLCRRLGQATCQQAVPAADCPLGWSAPHSAGRLGHAG